MILYDIRSDIIKLNKNYSNYYIESKTIIYFQTSVIITKNTLKTMILTTHQIGGVRVFFTR